MLPEIFNTQIFQGDFIIMFCLIAQFNISHFITAYQISTLLEYLQHSLNLRFGLIPQSHLHYLNHRFILPVLLQILLEVLLNFFKIRLLMFSNFHFFFFSFQVFLFFYSNFLIYELFFLKIWKKIIQVLINIRKMGYK